MNEDIEIDKSLEIKIINHFMPITQLMTRAGIDYREDSNFLCPFHPNYNSPSAHLYLDSSDGGGKIWCYSEQRMYGSWNLIKQYFPETNTQKLALGIVQKFGKEEIEKQLGEIEVDNSIPFEKSIQKFKENKITYKQLCKEISECYQ